MKFIHALNKMFVIALIMPAFVWFIFSMAILRGGKISTIGYRIIRLIERLEIATKDWQNDLKIK